MVKENLEDELRKWREKRSRKSPSKDSAQDRRTVRVNGQEVVVVTKSKRSCA